MMLKVGLLQPNTKKLDLKYNFQLMERLASIAVKKGAQIVCTPECILDGYSFDDPAFQTNPRSYAIDPNLSEIARSCRELASRLAIYMIVGMSLIEPGEPPIFRNAAILYDPRGNEVGRYFKVHSTFNNLESRFYTLGTSFPVFEARVGDVSTKIGIMICYDRQLPESARALRLNGAEIIFNPSATNNFWHAWNTRLLQTRAYENKCFLVSINHAWPRRNGRSIVLSPRGTILARCAPWQSVKVVRLDLQAIQKSAKDLKTRRPETYADLVKNPI